MATTPSGKSALDRSGIRAWRQEFSGATDQAAGQPDQAVVEYPSTSYLPKKVWPRAVIGTVIPAPVTLAMMPAPRC